MPELDNSVLKVNTLEYQKKFLIICGELSRDDISEDNKQKIGALKLS